MPKYNLPEKFFESLQSFFLERGFNEQQFKDQMMRLSQLAVISAFARLVKQKPPSSPFNSEAEATTYIEKNFSEEDIQVTIEDETRLLVTDYFKNFEVLPKTTN